MNTVIGLFDTMGDARNVVNQLVNAGYDRNDISLIANNASGEYQTKINENHTDEGNATGAGATTGAVVGGALGILAGLGALAIPGIGPVIAAGPLLAGLAGAGVGALAGGLVGSLVEAGLPEEDARYYTEGVRRGGILVVAKVDNEASQEAVEIMNRNRAVDIRERSADWESRGWTGYDANAEAYNADEINQERAYYAEQADASASLSSAVEHTELTNDRDEMAIPIVEEELRVGKREVQDGGVRVSTEVVEEPIAQDVSLREEHVHVERRPVDRAATDADFESFREGTLELTETHEEAIVDKRARVVEEVIVRKEVDERTETIRDTVRHTEVDVENIGTDTTFRTHFDTTYSGSDGTYEQYLPAYRYGTTLANRSDYTGRAWSDIESDARTQWETDQPGTWEQVKGAVQHAWDQVRGRA